MLACVRGALPQAPFKRNANNYHVIQATGFKVSGVFETQQSNTFTGQSKYE